MSALGVMALCADPELKNFLKERIDLSACGYAQAGTIEGIPCGVVTEKPSRFKRVMGNRIVHWGSEIITSDYEEQVIKRANQELNQLVNEYRRPEIAPFSPSGDSSRNNRDSAPASHINFIVVEIPDPVNSGQPVRPQPDRVVLAGGHPGGKVKCLGLDIQISMGE